jgi:hypothetical protein
MKIKALKKMVMQLKSQACKSTRAIGQRLLGTWSVALLCGSVVAACSGTIDTPTDEYPARQGDGSAAGGTASSTPSSSNATASAGTSSTPARTPAASDDDDEPAATDDDPPAAADDDEPAATDDNPPAASTTDLAFEDDIWPIFQSNCGPCHVSIGLGNQNIGSDDIDTALSDAKSFEDGVLREIEAGTMPPSGCGAPPGGAGCVSEDDYEAIKDWYAAGAPE